jgi:hypothetical protein
MAGLTATGRLSGAERGALHFTLWAAVAGAAALLRHLPVVAICLVTALFCRQVLQYRPLAKFGTHAVGVVGIVVCCAGALPGIFESVATIISAEELGLPGPDQSDVRETVFLPFLPFDWSVLAIGIFLIVVAGAFQMGAIQLSSMPDRSGPARREPISRRRNGHL